MIPLLDVGFHVGNSNYVTFVDSFRENLEIAPCSGVSSTPQGFPEYGMRLARPARIRALDRLMHLRLIDPSFLHLFPRVRIENQRSHVNNVRKGCDILAGGPTARESSLAELQVKVPGS